MIRTKVVHQKVLFFCEPYQMWLTPEGCEKIRNRKKPRKSSDFSCTDSFAIWSEKCKKCELWKDVKIERCRLCGGEFIPYTLGNNKIKRYCHDCLDFRKNVVGRAKAAFEKLVFGDGSEYGQVFLDTVRSNGGSFKKVLNDIFSVYFKRL